MRSLGGTASLAWFSQIILAAVVVLVVSWVWTQPMRYDLKASSPGAGFGNGHAYLYFYDLTILAVPAAFLVVDGLKHGFARFERLAILAGALCTVTFVAGIYAPLGPFIMLLFAVVVVVRLRSRDMMSLAMNAGS